MRMVDLDESREALAKSNKSWGAAKSYWIVWGLIYVGDCLRDLAQATRENAARERP